MFDMAESESFEKTLEKTGLSRNEAKVFLALLDLGPSPIGKISSESKIHRTNAYDAIERLIEKGLISYSMKDDSTKMFEAADPSNLVHILDDKKSMLEMIIPSLKMKKEMIDKQSQAQVFEGVASFTRILDNLLKFNEPILVYGIPKRAPEMMKHFIPSFHKKRIPLKIPMLHIYNHSAMDRIKYLNSLPFTEARYLSSELDSEVSTNICGDEVVFAIWSDPVMVIQIKNKVVAESYKRYFYHLWSSARKD